MLTFFLGFLLGVIITITAIIMYVLYIRKQAEKQLELMDTNMPGYKAFAEEWGAEIAETLVERAKELDEIKSKLR